ncbi:hypothetical protein HY491_01510 [Candidatus Woesearchaeota archaeon]|nr:hypothetical protein [Candidatus Woesearchaeota archaeon]
MKNYLPQKNTGYLHVLREFRTDIPLATRDVYNLEVVVEGNLPKDIQENLPLFGNRYPSDRYALSSGGRGILLSDGAVHLRLKGCDIDGTITRMVANGGKNVIADIALAAQHAAELDFGMQRMHSGKVFHLPSYKGNKPFSFLTSDAARNEAYASGALGDAFEKNGFYRPYVHIATVTYPSIQWQNQPCTTLAFSLPSLESDFRLEEFYRLAYWHLKFATREVLEYLQEDFGALLSKLTTWHGFVTRAMEEAALVPSADSHQHQNYVISHVHETEIGASRVDHTSTRVDKGAAMQYADAMKRQVSFFGDLHLVVLHAIALAKQHHAFNEDRYTNYFDRAYKWYDPINLAEVPGSVFYWELLDRMFAQGYQKDPIPIPQEEFIGLVERLHAIQIDHELQARVHRHMESQMPPTGRKRLPLPIGKY